MKKRLSVCDAGCLADVTCILSGRLPDIILSAVPFLWILSSLLTVWLCNWVSALCEGCSAR